jgi:hypothetical protein
VAEYLYAQTDQEVWDIETDFPCLAPPWPNFWMEFVRPSRLFSEGKVLDSPLPHRTGLWFQYYETAQLGTTAEQVNRLRGLEAEYTRELERLATPAVLEAIRAARARGLNLTDPHDPEVGRLDAPVRRVLGLVLQLRAVELYGQDPAQLEGWRTRMLERGERWIADCYPFIQPARHGPVIGPLGRLNLTVKSDGSATSHLSGFNRELVKESNWAALADGISSSCYAGLLAISFCHCKNISLHPEKPADPALQKRQMARGQRPRVSFQVLEITPIKQVLDKTRSEHQTGLKRALHICRGHFASYEEKALFGKYRGRFWIPQHVRGSIQEGAAMKDYAVQPPSGPTRLKGGNA